MNRTRILVAEQLRIVRSGVCSLLARECDFEVVEAASLDGVEAVVARGCPDIALVDLELPPAGGIEAVRTLAKCCHALLIVWGLHPSDQEVLAAVRAGAHGVLRKQISPAGLVRTLRGVVRGEAPLPRDLTATLIAALHGAGAREEALGRASVLSAREREVLAFLARGMRNREIAMELAISEFTVKRHVQNILQKLELPSRAAAARLYRTAFSLGEAPAVAG